MTLTTVLICSMIGMCLGARAARVKQQAVNELMRDSSLSKTSTWCVALSGNGGNWASTLGFISEALLLKVKQLELEASPESAKVNLRCSVGASSGAATTVLLRSLLANPSFGVSSDGLATLAQARSIGRALSFLAQTTDLGKWEIANTLMEVIKTKFEDWGEEAWAKNAVAIDVPHTLLQFGRTIALARHMESAWTELDVTDMISSHCSAFNVTAWFKTKGCHKSELVDVAKNAGLIHAADLPAPKTQDDQTQAAQDEVQEQLTFIMEDVSAHLLDFTKRKLKTIGFTFGQTNGLEVKPGTENMVDKVLAETPEDGFMTATFAHQTDYDPLLGKAHYATARVLAFMSRGTAEAILASQSYRRQILACSRQDASGCRNVNRFILAVVETVRPMIVLPTMEPGMLKPHSAPLSSMGVTAIFDPKIASMAESLALKSTSEGGNFDPIELILGGFVDRGQSVALQQFYTEGMKQSGDVEFALFGKATDPLTAKKAVAELLSEEADGEANWQLYKDWASPRPTNTFIDGYINWDCGAGLPANIRGASWQLRLHGATRARMGLADGVQADIFDPMKACEDA